MAKAMVVPADKFAASQAESAHNGREDGVEAAVMEMIQENGGRRHGGGWWKRLVVRTGDVMLTIMPGVVGASMFQG